MDNTKRLEQYNGRYIRVNYNVAQDVHKPSVMFVGNLIVGKRYYEVRVTDGTWIVFTDENISNVWYENPLYVEIRG